MRIWQVWLLSLLLTTVPVAGLADCGHCGPEATQIKADCGHCGPAGKQAKSECGHCGPAGKQVKADCGHCGTAGKKAKSACGHCGPKVKQDKAACTSCEAGDRKQTTGPDGKKVVVPSLLTEKTGLLNTPGLLALIQSRAPVVILDARSGKFDDGNRIPGAKALAPGAPLSEVRKVLRSQDNLVVTYCANLACGASHKLAEHLRSLGYRNLLEYPEGIAGWEKAGHPVEKAR